MTHKLTVNGLHAAYAATDAVSLIKKLCDSRVCVVCQSSEQNK